MSAWIKMIPEGEASGVLKEMYERAMTPHGTVDNVMKVHSLRPLTMQGHVTLYKSVLHNSELTLPLALLEIAASFTSILNECAYSLTHHFMNVRRLLGDEARADEIYAALKDDRPERVFKGKELAILEYTRKLTREVAAMREDDVLALREAGCDDGEILEVNQVVAYFNYSNRLLNGLGVTTQGDAIGYYSKPAPGQSGRSTSSV
jgi:uncharacterized peroxidase-related enzyme